jgi:hypothetical protein
VPNTMCILRKPRAPLPVVKKPEIRLEKEAKKPAGCPPKDKLTTSKSGASSGLDSDLETLQNSLAGAEARKERYGAPMDSTA